MPSSLSYLAKYLKIYKLRFLSILIALFFSAASFLSIGFAIREIINNGFNGHNVESLNKTILLLFGVASLLALASSVRAYLIESTAEKITADIRKSIYKNLIHASPSYFEINRVSDIASRLLHDTSLIQSVIITVFSFCIRNCLMAVGGIMLLLSTSLNLSLYLVALIPLTIIPVIVLAKKIKINSKRSQSSIGAISAHIEETLSAIKTVQSYNQEEHEISKLKSIMQQYIGNVHNRVKSKSYLVATVIWGISLVTATIIWLGGKMVLQGTLSSGDLVSFIFYAIVVASSIGGMSEVIADVNRASGGVERILELLTLGADHKKPTGQQNIDWNKKYKIEFKNVEFTYPSRPKSKVLENFSMSVNKGEKVVLSGASGSGKSTILQLLLGFYQLKQGAILIDNINIANLDLMKLREAIAFVSQDTFIFSASAYDNIAYGKKEAKKEEVLTAAKLANIDDFIRSLPEQYDTFLGEKGINLSGGQKQRIAIARAILKDPKILLLDEATSNLDADNEFLVQKALDELMTGRTTFVVSHRTSIAEKCSKVIMIKKAEESRTKESFPVQS